MLKPQRKQRMTKREAKLFDLIVRIGGVIVENYRPTPAWDRLCALQGKALNQFK